MKISTRNTRSIRFALVLPLGLWVGSALASQGPGAGAGTAGHFTQLAMAILVYGAAAIMIGCGLIGIARGRG